MRIQPDSPKKNRFIWIVFGRKSVCHGGKIVKQSVTCYPLLFLGTSTSASHSDFDGGINLPADDLFLVVPIAGGGISAQQKQGY